MGSGRVRPRRRRDRAGASRVSPGGPRHRPHRGPARRAALAVSAAAATAATATCGPSPTEFHVAYAEIVAEEDARGELGMTRVLEHLQSADPRVRAAAVRALGRLEDPERAGRIEPLLGDGDPLVRAAAATALAQSVFGADPGSVITALAGRVPAESDPSVLGSLATGLGRLQLPDPARRSEADAALTAVAMRLLALDGDPDLATRLGLSRGIEAFARGGQSGDTLSAALVSAAVALATLTAPPDSPGAESATRIRRTATAALGHTGQLGAGLARRLLRDPDWGVRRQVVLGANRDGTAIAEIIPAALEDPDPRVRLEAVRAHHRWLRPTDGCDAIIAAVADPDPRVAETAIGLLARPCGEAEAQVAALRGHVAEMGAEAAGAEAAGGEVEGAEVAGAEMAGAEAEGGEAAGAEAARAGSADWRLPARALHALAGIAPGEVTGEIRRFARHANPFVRAWAARAAGQARLEDVLTGLSGDSDPNVREAALQGLGVVAGGGAGDIYQAQLDQDDPQLVMTAARHIARMVPGETSVPPLLAALARFTARERETERDVRVALLEAIGTVGGFSEGDLAPYLTDYDAVVAGRAAALLGAPVSESPAGGRDAPRGAEAQVAPRPLPRTPPPDAARLARLEQSAVRLRMAGLGDIVIALRPDLAATNADRFARLAAEGYFDGLTFQRVEPNFVIQGGSPNANEYSGDGPYSRDEIGDHPHWRGTVGLSTRGRDTGDAQMFINLADNLRLDFNYTIYGVVVEGMEVVDAIREGAVIESAAVVRR